MPKSNINILDGLSFGERNAQHERMMNISFHHRIGALSCRREHSVFSTVPGTPQTIIYHITHNARYTMTREGSLYREAGLVLGGYSTPATLVEATPNRNVTDTWLFIASNPMHKYSGMNIYEWGISAPPDAAPAVALGGGVSTQLHNCDTLTGWVAAPPPASIVTDTAIKQEGSGSLRLSLGDDTLTTITLTFPAPLDFSAASRAVLAFWLRMENPKAITRFSVLFALANDDFATATASRELMSEYAPVYPGSVPEQAAATVPQTESSESNTELVDVSQRRLTQIPSVPSVWKQLSIARDTFALSPANSTWNAVYRMRLTVASSLTQNIHFDDFRILAENQDDALGARYKYAYESTLTQHRGNLNLIPSRAIRGEHNSVIVSGFYEPPTGQGIDMIHVFRDVGSNGNYQSVGTVAIAFPWDNSINFVDTVGVRNLGDVDLNDNARPMPASIVIRHLGSFWLNDLSNVRRMWRTPPGRFESFSLSQSAGFFDVGEVGDRIVAFGVVAGQFFIWTLRAIYMVLNPQATPVFRKMVDVGTVNQYALCIVNDLAVFAWWDGIYTFDGAQLRKLPKIGALFDLNSVDERRVVEATIQDIVLGSDGKYVWVTYGKAHGRHDERQTFLFDHITQQWTEESQNITAHEQTNVLFSHIFGAADGNILYAFANPTAFVGFDFESADAELANISFVTGIGIDIAEQQASALLQIYVDNILVKEFSISPSDTRRWELFSLDDDTIGQYCRIKLVSSGSLELYNAYIEYKAISDTTYLDSGPISISGRITQTGVTPSMTRAAALHVDTKILGLDSGEVKAYLQMDNAIIDVGTLTTVKGQVAVLQQTVEHITGSVLRVRVKGTRFAPISITAGLSIMGSKEAEYVAIPLNT